MTLHRTQLQCSQVQKRSKDIKEIVHVTSVVQLQCYEATRILFVRKKNKINNNFSQQFFSSLSCLQRHAAIVESITTYALASGSCKQRMRMLKHVCVNISSSAMRIHCLHEAELNAY